MNYFDKVNIIKQNVIARVSLHVIFWVIIVSWVWKDYTMAGTPQSEADYIVFVGEISYLIFSFYTLSYILTRSFLKIRIIYFLLFVVGSFIVSEYFVYFLFTIASEYGFESKYNLRVLKILNESSPRLIVLLWLDKGVIFMTMAFHFFYLIVPFSIKSILELYKYVQSTQRLERENIALELNFLRSQLNPHFLFNTLNNIYSMAIDTDEKVASMVLMLSDLMRYSLYESNNDVIILRREIQFLDDYIELEKIRLTNRASITFEREGTFDLIKVPPLIFLTFIENAFKHGIHSTKDPAFVKVKLIAINNSILFTVINSIPINPVITNLNKVGGIGLANARKRLTHFYKDNYHITINKGIDNYTLILKINL